MKACDYIVDVLIKHGTTEAFGIPGGVVLDMMYAMQRRSPEINPHLCYHEQGAGFAAVGYAQTSRRLCVAYGTRGPGFTNMITPMADAYADSIPVLFITSHISPILAPNMRILVNQEIDTCRMVAGITKYAKRIDTIEDFVVGVREACDAALQGRRGPVFLDIASRLWNEEVPEMCVGAKSAPASHVSDEDIAAIELALNASKRPILLIGDGINQTDLSAELNTLVDKWQIPVLSSRYAHYTIAKNSLFYGYIGCFGLRYANFILSKTDLIISLGNRLNFPLDSKSYGHIPQQAKFIRFDLDETEFNRSIPNAMNIHSELNGSLKALNQHEWTIRKFDDWLNVCNTLRSELSDADMEGTPEKIMQLLTMIPENTILLNDIGVNEFWVSRACAKAGYTGQVLYSKNFATMGNALPKAIGAYYATHKPVVCTMGDQAFQLNIQELQTISQNKLPIMIIILNNHVSGMIRDKEKKKYGSYLHTTSKSGYGLPNIKKVAEAYGFNYWCFDIDTMSKVVSSFIIKKKPILINMDIQSEIALRPYLPMGYQPQEMMPMLEETFYNNLNNL